MHLICLIIQVLSNITPNNYTFFPKTIKYHSLLASTPIKYEYIWKKSLMHIGNYKVTYKKDQQKLVVDDL